MPNLAGTANAGGSFPATDSNQNKGGFMTVANNTERDAIIASRRRKGMRVDVDNGGSGAEKTYRYTGETGVKTDGAAWEDVTSTGSSGTGTIAALTPSAAGNSAATVTGLINTVRLSPSAGSGAFTYILTIPVATAGKKVFVELALPASTNPTIEIRDLTTGGTLLFSATGQSTLGNGTLVFNSDGTNWTAGRGNFIGYDNA